MGFVSVSMLLLTVHTQRGKINFSFQGRSYCFRRDYQVHAGKGIDCGHEMIDGPSKKKSGGESKRLWLYWCFDGLFYLCPRRLGGVVSFAYAQHPLRCLNGIFVWRMD